MKKLLIVAVIALAVTSSAFTSRAFTSSAVTQQCLLTFFTESIPDSTVGVPVNFSFDVCCGTPPYRFAIVDGALPAGLHLNQNGKITGKPTAVDDTTVFIQLSDAAGCTLTQAFVSRVNPAP